MNINVVSLPERNERKYYFQDCAKLSHSIIIMWGNNVFFWGGFLPFPSPTFMANCLLMIKLSVKIGSLCNVHHAHQFYNNDNGIYEWISPFNPLFTIMTWIEKFLGSVTQNVEVSTVTIINKKLHYSPQHIYILM